MGRSRKLVNSTMADDDHQMYFKVPCAYCGKNSEAWISHKEWRSGKAMAKCKLCPLPTLLNPDTVQSSASTSSTSNMLPSPETPRPTRHDLNQFVREETQHVMDENPKLNSKQAGFVARRNWPRNGYDWWMRQQGAKTTQGRTGPTLKILEEPKVDDAPPSTGASKVGEADRKPTRKRKKK